MKNPPFCAGTAVRRPLRRLLPALLLCGAATFGVGQRSACAVTYYWDTNGTTAGSGAASTGTLGTDAFLNTSSTGGAGTFSTIPTANDTIQFVAQASTSDTTSGSTASTVDINGTAAAPQTVLGITLNIAGDTNSNSDALTLGTSNSEELDIGSGGINVPRASTGSSYNGTLIVNANIGLTASQTWTFNSVATNTGTFNGNIITASGATSPTNLTITSTTGRSLSFNGGVNISGSLSESQASGNAYVYIYGVIGSNVTGLNVSNTNAPANYLQLGSTTTAVTNTYGGTTSVTSGTLILDASSTATGSQTSSGAVNITGTNAVLAGSGGISSGLLTVTSAGQITPGTTSGQTFQHVGTLHLGTSGGVTLTSAVLNYDLATTAAAASDKIILGTGSTATGSLTLGTLTFNFEGAASSTGTVLQVGTPYTLITADNTFTVPSSITTNFLGGLAGQGYSATYSEDASDDLQVTFSVTPVPEPSTWIGAAATILAGAWSQRKRLGMLLQ